MPLRYTTDIEAAEQIVDKEITKVLPGTRVTIEVNVDALVEKYSMQPAYQPKEICCDGKRYILKEPLQCKVVREGRTIGIEYDPLGIWGAGDTWEEAVDFFNYQFADTYEWLNELHDHKGEPGVLGIGDALEKVRQLINSLVINVAQQ
jgi:hypothetical protein